MRLTYWRRGPVRTLRVYVEVMVELPDDRLSIPYVERAMRWLAQATDKAPNGEWVRLEECVYVRSRFKNAYSDIGLVWWCNKDELKSAFRRLVKVTRQRFTTAK